MKRAVAACAILLALAGCSGAEPRAPAATAPAAGSRGAGTSLVVNVKGQLDVKRDGWTTYAPALLGTVARGGDLLRLDGASQASILCGSSGNLRLVPIARGTNGVPCAIERPLLEYGGSQVTATRGDVQPDVPVVLSPRKTKVLSPAPVLRWTSVPGVQTYTVKVSGPGGFSWSQTVEGKSELTYPEGAPRLKPGGPYTLRVEAGLHNSDEEGTPGRGFTVLGDADAQQVRDDQRQIEAFPNLTDAEKHLVMAQMLASRGIYADAIDNLEAVASASQEPAVARLLGDIFFLEGVNRVAEKWYQTALQWSETVHDLEGQGLAERGLAQTYEALGISDAAAHWQAAQAVYQKLGDAGQVSDIQSHLTSLAK